MAGWKSVALAGAVLVLSVGSAGAEEVSGRNLAVELNAVQPTEKGCRFTFVVRNGLGKSVSRAAFEMALFDRAGVVDRLSVLEFRDLAIGKTKVSRFELADVDCTNLDSILINATTACEGEGLDPAMCGTALRASSKAAVALGL